MLASVVAPVLLAPAAVAASGRSTAGRCPPAPRSPSTAGHAPRANRPGRGVGPRCAPTGPCARPPLSVHIRPVFRVKTEFPAAIGCFRCRFLSLPPVPWNRLPMSFPWKRADRPCAVRRVRSAIPRSWSFCAEILPLWIALRIAGFPFPTASAASLKLYAIGVSYRSPATIGNCYAISKPEMPPHRIYPPLFKGLTADILPGRGRACESAMPRGRRTAPPAARPSPHADAAAGLLLFSRRR